MRNKGSIDNALMGQPSGCGRGGTADLSGYRLVSEERWRVRATGKKGKRVEAARQSRVEDVNCDLRVVQNGPKNRRNYPPVTGDGSGNTGSGVKKG
jgi:hypothetical protein